jgi:parallel beta-helix repeat protein
VKIKFLIFFVVFLGWLTLQVGATDYYVRTTGNNKNSGLANTDSEAWATIGFAITKLIPGDRLFVADGTYKTPKLRLQNLHAEKELPTIIQSLNPWGARIELSTSNGWDNMLEIANCQHLIFDGFELFDASESKGSGIDVREKSHHITISNCYVHDCGCGGISSRVSDYLTFENNVVRDNAKRSEWNCSGISIWHPVESDKEPGYHMIIRGNVAFENECELPFSPMGHSNPTDGNGIIIDDYYNTQGGGQDGGYPSATLVENNLCFNNGGRGIAIYKSDKVTVRHNTIWHNMYVLSKYGKHTGDLEFFESRNSEVFNNIVVQNPNLQSQALRMYEASNHARVYNNLVVGIKDFWPIKPIEKNNVIKASSEQDYPALINPTKNIVFDSLIDFSRYFGLKETSPAIDNAFAEQANTYDLLLASRPFGKIADLGCFEFGAAIPTNTPTSIIPKMKAYPNPCSDVLTVVGHENFSIELMTITGKIVKRLNNQSGLVRLDLHQLSSGVYLLKYFEEKTCVVKQIIKQDCR